MAVKAPVRVSQKIIMPLSVVMVTAALFAFFDELPIVNKDAKARVFTTSRMPTGEHFLTYRQRTAPQLIYRFLHALPAIIWSIGMPLQHVDRLRKKWPVLHRTAGYVLLSLSLLLSITGYYFFLSKHAYTHPNPLHLHNLNGLSPIPWPTFEVTTWLVGPFYWLTMYKTATTARARDFVRHRKWAVMHTIFASVIAAERVGIVVMYSIGFTLATLPQAVVHDFFGVGYTVEEMAEAEMSVFAFANIFAFTFVFTWMYYEFGRAREESSVPAKARTGKKGI